jgi:outer membrane protein assembly factor BamB
MKKLTGSVFLCAFLASTSLAQWPQFRGPHASGVGDKAAYPLKWDKKHNVVWQTEIPGRGWSSPIVWGEQIFVTAVLNDKTPPPRRGLYIQDLIGKVPPGEHRWVVYCLDWNTGKILWQRTAHQGKPAAPIHLKNTYASETPVTDGKRVIAYFGNLGLFCYSMKGEPLWSRKWESYPTRMGWGTAASPVLFRDRLYIVNDNDKNSFLVAVDAATGKDIWRAKRDEKSNWATPLVWENERGVEIVTSGTDKVRSYDLNGKLLWELAGMSSIVIPTPTAHGGLLYISSGYIMGFVRPVYAIRPGATGDISLKRGETANNYIAWCQKLAGPYHPTPLAYGDYLYVLYDRGMLACYHAATGKEIYKTRINPAADKFTASPVAADGKIYCLSEDGDTFVIAAGPKFQVLARNPLDEMCLATPALARGNLVVRTMSKVYRLGQK